jgi:hypothetical protein
MVFQGVDGPHFRAAEGRGRFGPEHAIMCAWRLRRVYRIETGLFRKAWKAWTNGTAATSQEIKVVFLRLASQEDELSKLTRYKTSLERSLQRALKALERRQAMRAAIALGVTAADNPILDALAARSGGEDGRPT